MAILGATRGLWLFIVLALLVSGCAKRPMTATATAPAPTTAAPKTDVKAGGASDTTKGGAARQVGSRAPSPSSVAPEARPAPAEFVATPDLRDVHFDFDKYDIRPKDAEILGVNARWLKTHSTYLVLIEGHCDERGTNEYNLVLGERRAKAVMNFLVAQGVTASRISAVSYGEERPICREKTEACSSTNRRAHFFVKAQ